MHFQPSLLWNWKSSIDRLPYLLTGILLFAVKFAIDWLIATRIFSRPWSPMQYLIWPNERAFDVMSPNNPERWFALTMLAVSVPFIWTGVMLTAHRLRAAALPAGLVLLFFVPLVNLLFFAVLSVLPTVPSVLPIAPTGPVHFRSVRNVHRRLVRDNHWRSGLVALLIAVPAAVFGVVACAQLFQSYGLSLFVLGPFALGLISVLLFGFSRPQQFGPSIGVAVMAATLAGAVLFSIGIEGMICLIMAAPITFALVILGAVIGFFIQQRPWLDDQTVTIALLVVLVLPAVMAAEAANEPAPTLRMVQTVVIIEAAPDEVWPHVISFPPLREPDDWFFQTGVAYPQRAEIHGSGVGAVRHCVFSTGAFVEPITVWNPPNLLRFKVTDQPEPMHEWSLYDIHPAHMEGYLVSREGQFELEALPDGRTRLTGTTWYTNRMWPAPYWNLWSDYIIHRIHGRVLEHVKGLAERTVASGSGPRGLSAVRKRGIDLWPALLYSSQAKLLCEGHG